MKSKFLPFFSFHETWQVACQGDIVGISLTVAIWCKIPIKLLIYWVCHHHINPEFKPTAIRKVTQSLCDCRFCNLGVFLYTTRNLLERCYCYFLFFLFFFLRTSSSVMYQRNIFYGSPYTVNLLW